MAADYVWLSTVMTEPGRLRPFTNDLLEKAKAESREVESYKRNDAGERLGPDQFPAIIWGAADRGARTFKNLPDIIFGYGFYVVSARCAEVLRQFDLGAGALYAVRVLQKDKETPVADHGWFCINFGNQKRVLLPDQSKNIEPWPGGRWTARAALGDSDIAVSSGAVSGADIWVEPLFERSLFLSGALGDNLRSAKCASGWGLKKCRVVAG
jgi:hypothetical protein